MNMDKIRPYLKYGLPGRSNKGFEISNFRTKRRSSRMVEYGFVEGTDFNLLKKERVHFEGNRQVTRQVDDAIKGTDFQPAQKNCICA